MRQFRILFRRSGSKPGIWATLRPHVNAQLYDKLEVNAAIEHMRVNPHVTGMAVQLDDEIFNVIAFNQDAEAAQAFKFVEPQPAEAAGQ